MLQPRLQGASTGQARPCLQSSRGASRTPESEVHQQPTAFQGCPELTASAPGSPVGQELCSKQNKVIPVRCCPSWKAFQACASSAVSPGRACHTCSGRLSRLRDRSGAVQLVTAPRAGVLPVAHGPPSRYIRAGCRPQCAERSARQSAGRAKRQRKMRLCPRSGAWLLSQVAHQETTAGKVLRHAAAHRVPHVPLQAQLRGVAICKPGTIPWAFKAYTRV